MKIINILFGFILFVSLLTACSQDSVSSGSNNGNVNEKGTYTYQYRYNSCDTGEHTFNNKKNYCQALTDEKFNSGCALELRKDQYIKECGSDFKRTNFKSDLWYSGFDERLQKRCSTYDSEEYFSTENEYCVFLKNESLHKNCFWDARKQRFDSLNCANGFSQEPPRSEPANPNPTPQPNPTPSPTPQPSPNPNDPGQSEYDLITQEFEQHGIKLDVKPEAGGSIPGELPFSEQRRLFFGLISNNKEELFKRNSLIKEINLASYVTYYSKYKSISLDYNLKDEELQTYLEKFDERVAFENTTGIKLDLGVEIYGHEADKLAYLNSVLSVLNSKKQKLINMSSLINNIKFESYNNYYFSSRELYLNKDKFQDSLLSFIDYLYPLSPFFNFAEKNNIEISGNIEVDKYRKEFKAAVEQLASQSKLFEKMVKLDKLKKIELNYFQNENLYYDSLKLLGVALALPGSMNVQKALNALNDQMDVELALGIKVKNDSNKLNEDYIACSSRLKKYQNSILNKKKYIREINLNFYKSDFSYGALYISSKDSNAEFEKVLQNIK